MNEKELLAYVAALERAVFKTTLPGNGKLPEPAYVAELERRAKALRDPQTENFKKGQRREAAHRAVEYAPKTADALRGFKANFQPSQQERDRAWWTGAEAEGRRLMANAEYHQQKGAL